MFFTLLLSGTILLVATPVQAEEFAFDKSQTIISFSARYLGFADIVGRFNNYDGSFWVDENRPEASQINIVLRSASVRTSSVALDEILQGKHWFNSHQFPEIRFVSTAIRITGRETAILIGNLTFIGQTRPVVFAVRFHPVSGSDKISFDATGTIHLSEFSLSTSAPLIVNNVYLFIHVIGVRKS